MVLAAKKQESAKDVDTPSARNCFGTVTVFSAFGLGTFLHSTNARIFLPKFKLSATGGRRWISADMQENVARLRNLQMEPESPASSDNE
jgi:hypothetical protein